MPKAGPDDVLSPIVAGTFLLRTRLQFNHLSHFRHICVRAQRPREKIRGENESQEAADILAWGEYILPEPNQNIEIALGYHLKTGHQLSLQNRPTEPHSGLDDVLPCRRTIRQVLLD